MTFESRQSVEEDVSDIEIPSEYESDVEFDERSAAPVVRLDKAFLSSVPVSSQGISLKYALSPMNNVGVAYVSTLDGKSSAKNTQLYPFQEPGSLSSDSYNRYCEACFANFREILEHKKYKTMSSDLEIGVASLLQQMKKEKAERLDSFLLSLIEDLGELIIQYLEEDDFDESAARGFETAMAVLNLFRSLYFSERSERIGLLCTWINRAHLLDFEELQQEYASEGDETFASVLFWSEYVQKLVVRGLFEEAVSAIKDSGFEKLETTDPNLYLFISDFCTLLSSYDSVAFAVDEASFLRWKQSMCQLRDKFGELELDPKYEYYNVAKQLEILFSITSGSPKTISDNARVWYEALVAHYLFVLPDPTVIQEFLKENESLIHSSQSSFTWETACINMLEGNILEVLREVETFDKCTATYLSVLCEAGGLFDDYIEILGDSEFEKQLLNNTDNMLRDLALSYFNVQKLIPVGIGILWGMNEPDARQIIAEILPRWYFDNDDDFQYCLSVCSELKLSATSSQLYKQQGQIFIERGFLLESLNMFSMSGDIGLTARKTWELFESSLVSGDKLTDPVLDKLIQDPSTDIHPALRQCISPYAILVQFYELRKQGELEQAIEKLVSLIRFPYMQSYCTPLLLAQFVPFLGFSSKGKSSEVLRRVFDSAQLTVIMELLNLFEETPVQKSTAEKRDELFSIATSPEAIKAAEANPADWRTQSKKLAITIPTDVKGLMTLLRKSIAMEEAYLFLQ